MTRGRGNLSDSGATATGRWFPARRMTQAELESYLDTAANILRGSADHSEFRGYVFALLFYASGTWGVN